QMSTPQRFARLHARRARRALPAIAVTLAAGLAACGGGDGGAAPTSPPPLPTSAATSAPAPTTAATAVPSTAAATTAPATTAAATTAPPTTEPAVPRQPLTGQLLADWSEVTARPALVVKIDNATGARRNHTGIARADIVFEEIVEGSITRFAAVFHTQD